MACGRRGREVVEARTVAERWNRSGLQRAHLFAHACGGPFTVENVVLLCDLCHAESDAISSTLGPDAMLRWVARHEPWGEVVARHMTWAVPPELAGVAAFALGIYFQGGVDEVP
jgi:hypothetical protein